MKRSTCLILSIVLLGCSPEKKEDSPPHAGPPDPMSLVAPPDPDTKPEPPPPRSLWQQREALLSAAKRTLPENMGDIPCVVVPTDVIDDVPPGAVALSAGKHDGVVRTFLFAVVRRTRVIGIIEVERVLPDTAICKVVRLAEGESIKEGDSANTELKKLILKPAVRVPNPQAEKEEDSRPLFEQQVIALKAALEKGGDPPVGPAETVEIDGKVVAGPRDDDRLIVLSVGTDDRVQVGYVFAIYRGSQWIGQVEVVEVDRDMSLCQITVVVETKEVKPGDGAASRLY